MSKYFGLPEVAEFWESVVSLNTWHQHRISELVVKNLFGTISEKKISILGFAFKANTNDTRESAAIQICKDLILEGAELIIHDPKVNPKQISIDLGIDPIDINKNGNKNSQIKSDGGWRFTKNIYDSFESSDACLILTEWDDYSNINWTRASKVMRKPAWVFDARSIANKQEILDANLFFWRLGDGS